MSIINRVLKCFIKFKTKRKFQPRNSNSQLKSQNRFDEKMENWNLNVRWLFPNKKGEFIKELNLYIQQKVEVLAKILNFSNQWNQRNWKSKPRR